MLKNFIELVKAKQLFSEKDTLFIGVSGGVDSVVLCYLCRQAGFSFKIAHCNFQLREKDSDRDEDFVKKLGQDYGVEVMVKKFDTINYAEHNKCGIQEAARKLRYNWFYDLLDQEAFQKAPGSSYILTAHHANDNIETLLMNFFKGTGIRGLSGIREKSGRRNALIRPLLFAWRNEIEKYADEQHLSFVTDASNAEDKYTRNYFRNRLIPDIQRVFPEVEANLLHNIHRFSDIELLYKESIDRYKKKLIHQQGNEIHLPVLMLQKIPATETVLYEIVKDYGFNPKQLNDICKLLMSESGKYISSSSHKIIKNRNWLIISPHQPQLAQNIVIEKNATNVLFELGELKIKHIPNEQYHLLLDESVAQLNADKITFPLLLRKWKHGDYFYPLGMPKKKKVSRFLMDQKLSISEKEKIWVLEMDKKIIWVVGHRIDDRFKLTPTCPFVLQIKLLSPQ